ncbi:Leucine-rich repeat-containing protein [Artemisia annua]|uniref:Leucine-rich repeat-containing protein n=1 Tax=Artemisia annua TaxID=35608 RepID=A0A2U1M7M6_ARTAN|nr:Leucine-rich repeat-containing protein [Artemisia annua]
MEKKGEGYFPKENILKNEYDYVHNADLDDQSGWFYHLWLLDQTVKVDMPKLVTTSPPHGSDVNQSTFPVVLYFSEPVEGISSHTVTVQTTENVIFKNITWTPLSTSNYKCGQAWMTHLSIPHEDLNSSKTVQVKISSEHSQGITSLSGVSCNRPWSFTFMVSVCHDLQPVEGQTIERISLTDGNFCAIDTNSNRTALIKSYFESSSDFEDPISSNWKSEMIASEIEHFRGALKWAQGSKIVKLTLARLLMACDAVKSSGSPKLANVEEVLQLYTELMKLDPPHNECYKDEYSLVLLKQVTSSKESLLKYCCQYKESTPSNSLDLSHNQLHSIEGLEALQLLSCLNLSHNKLRSFMALDPLRFLKSSLKVLDISYNEIGANIVDTRRYLCSSPMSHTLDYDTKSEELAYGDAKSVNFWDAYSIFGGLNLMQLDIVGNVAVDERFVQFLVKIMHGLKWLDGEELN